MTVPDFPLCPSDSPRLWSSLATSAPAFAVPSESAGAVACLTCLVAVLSSCRVRNLAGASSTAPAWPLWAGVALYVLSFLALFPRTFAIVDEDAYLTQAFLLRSGRLSYEGSSIPAPHMSVEFNGRTSSKYPPGNSLFLAPFTCLGWRAVFVSGMILALAGVWLCVLILRRLAPAADPVWGLLYLFHPAVVLYSRTIMSDLLAACLVLASFYCLLRREGWLLLSGLLLGLACLVRYSNAVFVPVFLLLGLRQSGRRVGRTTMLLAGFAPLAALTLAYNQYAYGAPFSFPMYLTGHFSPAYFLHHARYYAVSLLLLYPLMLLAPLFAGRGLRLLLGLPAYALVLLYCFFSYLHDVPSLPERLTIGLRYLMPALPFLVIAYAAAGDRLERLLRGTTWLKYAGLMLMAALCPLLQWRHDRYLRVQQTYQHLVLEHVPQHSLLICDKDVSELVSYAWGWRDYRHLAQFNVPVPLDSALTGDRAIYAALLDKPGQTNAVEFALFETLLARFPGRTLLAETRAPWQLRLYRLRQHEASLRPLDPRDGGSAERCWTKPDP